MAEGISPRPSIDRLAWENVLFEVICLRKMGCPQSGRSEAYKFGESRRLPSVYMELGHLYRAIEPGDSYIHYYMVLNSSLNISIDQVERARGLSLNAKLEIAETHSELLEYEESYRHYELLSKLDLKPIERMRVDYRMCHLLYQLGRYQYAVPRLKQFLDHYRMSAFPGIRYLLAKSYEARHKPNREEVVQILRQSSPDTTLDGRSGLLEQRTGNELANEFYEKRDYQALTIYQSLAKYNQLRMAMAYSSDRLVLRTAWLA